MMNTDDPDQLIAYYSEVIEAEPDEGASFDLRAHAFRAKKDDIKAREDWESALKCGIGADTARVHDQLGYLAELRGDDTTARVHYEQAMDAALSHQRYIHQNNLAWLLATSKDEKVRNGAEAVRLATQANEAVKYHDYHLLGTLAAACAEARNFEDAVRWAEKCLQLTPETDKKVARERLDTYRAGKPYRATPK